RVEFPSILPGAYRLAVSNGPGWSTQTIYVNRADPRWISEERAFPGLPLKLIGRNLDASEYGGTGNTQVRLVPTDGSKAVVITPDAVNPYCVDFSVPLSIAAGNYYVEVSANSAEFGRDSVRLNNHSEYPEVVRATVVQVEPAPTNPTALALKVAWANDFNWTRVADAKGDFHAQGDGSTDDTRAIQNALDHVSQSGGGVVFLPKGVYKVNNLVLGSKCILQGESREETVVMVSKTGDDGAIVPRGSAQGISTMTLKYQPSVSARSPAMLLAGAANKVFLHNIKFDLLRNPDVSVHQSPYYFVGSGPLLVAHCQMYLSSRNLWDHAVQSRVTFRDNFIDMHDGLGLCMSSEKLLLLRNELTFHPASYAGQMNGFFLNEGWVGWNIYNAYIAGNNAHDLNGPGDCQPFAADSAWSCFAGAVIGSTANTVDARNDVSGDFKGLDTHEMELLVVQGRGLGQIRRMSAHRNLGGYPAVVRCTVSPPWDVPPDSTSVISAGSWHVNNVFYRNTARGSKSPYNMYYGGCYDCLDAEATSDNTEGWYNWGRIGEYPGQAPWHCPVYFNQLKRSTFRGISPTYSTMGITLRVENETKNYRGIGDYGTEIRDNMIDRAACANKNQRLAGNAAIATFNQSWMKVTPETPLIFATLCEGNRIKNSSVGFDLDGSFSFAIRGTSYENCPQSVNDKGHDTALLPGAPSPSRPLPIPTGRQ
ncbi:MAG: glycosyl hydrolase family 28-related protein, partial [Thermoguttaceae bacterium]